MDRIRQLLLWTNFVILEAKIANTLHDQMNGDVWSDLNPLEEFSFCVCNMGWYCLHKLLEISLANLFLLLVLSLFLLTVCLSK